VSQKPYQGTWEASKMKPWRDKIIEYDVSGSDSKLNSEGTELE